MSLKEANRIIEEMQGIEEGTLVNDIERYNLAKKAGSIILRFHESVKKQVEAGKKSKSDLDNATYLSEVILGEESYERKKLELYHRVNPDEIVSIAAKGGKIVGKTMGWGIVAAIVAGAGLYGWSWNSTRLYRNDAEAKYNSILQYVAKPQEFDREDLDRLVSDSADLNGIAANLVETKYPKPHDNKKKVEKYKVAITKFFEQRALFEKAKGLAEAGDRVGALGQTLNLVGIKEGLPESWHNHFDEFKTGYEAFQDENQAYKLASDTIEATDKEVKTFDKEFESLEESLKKGELFEKTRTDFLITGLKASIAKLESLKVEGASKDNVDKLKAKLKALEESVSGETGLLTGYAKLQFKRLGVDLNAIQKTLDGLREQDYLMDNPDEAIVNLNKVLQAARDSAQAIDNQRLEDPWTLFSRISTYGDRITDAETEFSNLVALRESAEAGDVSALVGLVQIYVEHDLDDGKWDGDADVWLGKIPVDQRELVSNIVEISTLESKLANKKGFLRVTKEGLTLSHLEDYGVAVGSYVATKVVRPWKDAVETLTSKTKIKEGAKAKGLVAELNTLQNEVVELLLNSFFNLNTSFFNSFFSNQV